MGFLTQKTSILDDPTECKKMHLFYERFTHRRNLQER